MVVFVLTIGIVFMMLFLWCCMSINGSANGFFIRFSSLRIFHVNLTTSEEFFFVKNFMVLYGSQFKIVSKIDYNSKNQNCQIDFSFDSALCASIIKMGTKLRGGRGRRVCIYKMGKTQNCFNCYRSDWSPKLKINHFLMLTENT